MGKKVIFLFIFVLSLSLVSSISPNLPNGNSILPNLADAVQTNNTYNVNYTATTITQGGGNVFDQDLNTTEDVIFNSVNVTTWFRGLFNWTSISNFLTFDGSNLDFDDGEFNSTYDNRYVEITGDSMTGSLNISGNLTVTGNVTANEFFGDIEADFVKIALGGGSPTIDQLQEYLDNTGSSGFFEGGDLTDGGSGTVDIASGSGFIRTTTDENSELQSFKWSASSGIAVTDDTTQYVYVDDSGVISLSTNEFL